ncbi:MAG: LysM peptidoglycan-binding domain-containing protein [Actinomycetota bacterium]|nr:LysM peptidoglycan-binding domain-containing protein [Actinomycetota bacterium]
MHCTTGTVGQILPMQASADDTPAPVRYRRRASVGEALLLVLTCALVFVALVAVRPGVASSDLPTRAIRVRASDTLWDIASENRTEGLSTAQTVEVLKTLNRLDHSRIAVGQSLLIPNTEEPVLTLANP